MIAAAVTAVVLMTATIWPPAVTAIFEGRAKIVINDGNLLIAPQQGKNITFQACFLSNTVPLSPLVEYDTYRRLRLHI